MMPTKPKTVDYQEVERLAGLGLSQSQIGAALNPPLSRSSVQRRLGSTSSEPDEAFEAAFRRGQARMVEMASNVVYEAIRGGDLEAAKWYLRNNPGAGFHEKFSERALSPPRSNDSEVPSINIIFANSENSIQTRIVDGKIIESE